MNTVKDLKNGKVVYEVKSVNSNVKITPYIVKEVREEKSEFAFFEQKRYHIDLISLEGQVLKGGVTAQTLDDTGAGAILFDLDAALERAEALIRGKIEAMNAIERA